MKFLYIFMPVIFFLLLFNLTCYAEPYLRLINKSDVLSGKEIYYLHCEESRPFLWGHITVTHNHSKCFPSNEKQNVSYSIKNENKGLSAVYDKKSKEYSLIFPGNIKKKVGISSADIRSYELGDIYKLFNPPTRVSSCVDRNQLNDDMKSHRDLSGCTPSRKKQTSYLHTIGLETISVSIPKLDDVNNLLQSDLSRGVNTIIKFPGDLEGEKVSKIADSCKCKEDAKEKCVECIVNYVKNKAGINDDDQVRRILYLGTQNTGHSVFSRVGDKERLFIKEGKLAYKMDNPKTILDLRNSESISVELSFKNQYKHTSSNKTNKKAIDKGNEKGTIVISSEDFKNNDTINMNICPFQEVPAPKH